MAAAERRFVPPRQQTTHVIDEADARATGPQPAARIRAGVESVLAAANAGTLRLPMLPETAAEAIALANDPRTPMNRLERVITRDAVLAARMLAVASSPAFAGTAVRSLGAALQRLGTGSIRDILYQSVMECHVFRGDDERVARAERDHAIAVARLAKGVCKIVGIDQEYAFVCGLLHDIGRMALQVLGAQITSIDCDPADRDAVGELAHTGLGSLMAIQWKLPALAVEAARRHHRYRGFGPSGDGYSQIGHVISVADRLACHLGVGRPPRELVEGDLQAIYELGCAPERLLEIAQVELG